MVYENINYESFYTGGYSSLNPEYGNFVGYRLGFGKLGSTTSIQTANQVNEVILRIREGVKNVEIQQIQPDVFEQIPKEQFDEIKAIMKLTGVKPSMHAPMIDPAGFDQERGYMGDSGREDAERRLFDAIRRGQKIDSNGNMPVIIHSSAGIPGTQWRPAEGIKPGEKERFKEQEIIVIDQESNQMQRLEEEKIFRPGMTKEELKKGRIFTPKERLESANETKWEQELTNLTFYKKHADEIIGNAPAFLARFANANANMETLKKMSDEEKTQYEKMQEASIFLDNVRMNFNNSFEKAYKYGNEKQKEALIKIAEKYSKGIKEVEGKVWQPVAQRKLLSDAINELKAITTLHKDEKGKIIGFGGAPEVLKNVEAFAMDKSAETIGNVAFKAYEKWGEKAPIMAVENWQPGAAFSRAEDLKELIKQSKDRFIKNAVAEGKSKKEAEKIADKLIGATWDLGHLNQLKKWGFKEEDIIKETEKIAKLVKHVHLSDNFGYTDSHLAPGMGNVPFKKIFQELEKAGTLKKSKAIIEAGALVNPNLGLKISPLKATMMGLGPGVYEASLPPYWNAAMGILGNYVGFPLAYMPEKHFSVYEAAAGFAGLPQELGGMIPGTRSRFSGGANA